QRCPARGDRSGAGLRVAAHCPLRPPGAGVGGRGRRRDLPLPPRLVRHRRRPGSHGRCPARPSTRMTSAARAWAIAIAAALLAWSAGASAEPFRPDGHYIEVTPPPSVARVASAIEPAEATQVVAAFRGPGLWASIVRVN